ncbi:MAG: MMPL family transporter [Blautia glucerasea]|uniref:efflux RND transporter permease subunit n=1 Tax=Blautia glucerasea TaxID=536633 RepID=UPI00156EEF35|nr:MMPL family transporter [Blautia glucerasea]MCI7627699.1 MMPL family transporter [Blautia glucerasea]MDY3085756.1 MMPL family transporter [Blautia sp.]NSJ27046.1 MMPL family transporter [Blautia glucerasea]
MVKVGKWIAKHKVLVLLIGLLLVFPSMIGIAKTRVNYDLLSYLPETLETVKGQDIMVDEFGMGAFSMVVVENMEMKDIQKLEDEFSQVEHVKDVLWYDDVADISLPVEMIPQDLREAFFKGDATMMLVLFDNTTSSDEAMDALTELRKLANKQCFISGMTGVVTDIKNIAMKELPIYVVIAAVLSLVVLELTSGSFVVPFLFLLSIGLAILYNLGSNIIFGETSYITQALTAVLQLGVTMDYSIFLLNSYEENKKRFPEDKNRAMGHAIANTFKSVAGSSVTTVAGFIALCVMTFALGRDLGIVMAKGVVIGVICCVTILPALVLFFDKPIEKTQHKLLLAKMDKPSAFITKHYKAWILVFLVFLLPAIYGNNHTKIYYNIAESLPATLDSNVANDELKNVFDMSNIHMIMMDKNMDSKEKQKMLNEIDQVDGVKWSISMNSLIGPTIPDSMIPEDIKKIFKGKDYELAFICSEYGSATDEVNAQIKAIDKIVKSYDKSGMVIGEAPLMKDLQDTTDADLVRVNVISIGAIFLIIMFLFKSISLPIILVAVIEFAIMINMAIPFYQGVSLPFVASIVIGAIQLGATVDYAILMTTRYQRERQRGKDKMESISIAHKTSMPSIISSGLSFFAATFGVSCYSQVEMIGSICTLLARGAIISMIVVLFVLPAMFMIFDKLICKTSIGFLGDRKAAVK